MHRLSAATGRLRKALTTMLVLALGVSVASSIAPAPARADAGVAVLLRRVTATPVLSGSPIDYELYFSCGAVLDPTCENSVIDVQIPNGVLLSAGTHPYVVGAVPTVGGYRITLSNSIPAGSSAKFDITLLTSNGTTPSTSFPVIATASLDNGSPAVSASDATLTATSNVSVLKTLVGSAAIGVNARYELRTCTANGDPRFGQLWFQTGRLVDTLPAGATYIGSSAGGVYSAVTNTVTWTGLSNLGSGGCSLADSLDAWVDVRYNSPTFTTSSNVTNSATVFGTPYGGASELSASTSINHGFLSATISGDGQKGVTVPYGMSSTYLGNWLDGVRDEAVWNLYFSNTSATPAEVRVVDSLPCQQWEIASQRYSGRPAGSPCATPLFIVESLGMDATNAASVTGQALQNAYQLGWRPTYLTSTGATGIFESTDLLNFYPVGLAAGQRISEVVLPRDPRFLMPANSGWFNFQVRGHIPADAPANLLTARYLENVLRYSMYSGGVEVVSRTSYASLGALAPAHSVAAVSRSFNFSTSGSVYVMNLSNVPAPLVAAVLLQPGVTSDWSFLYGAFGTKSPGGHPALTEDSFELQTIRNFGGTGRDLVRISSKPGVLVDPMSGVNFDFSFGNLTSLYPPGDIPYTLYSMIPGRSIQSCANYPISANTSYSNFSTLVSADPFDVDNDGRTAGGVFCQWETFKRIPAGGSTAPVLRTASFVQGDADPAELASPNVATITDGGTANYRLDVINSGSGALTDVWVYDILPFVGDTGVSSAMQTTARGSVFQPALTGPVTSTATATIEYSTSSNPCRPEVGVSSGCDAPGWTASPSTWSDVRSFRVRLASLGGTSTATLRFALQSPAGTAPGATAWNNAASTGSIGASALIPAESPKVGMARPLTDVSISTTFGATATTAGALTGEARTVTITAKHDTTVTRAANGALIYSSAATSTARGVQATVTLPAGLELIAGSVIGSGFNSATGLWNVGDLFVGSAETLTFQVRSSSVGAYRIGGEITANSINDSDSTPNNCPVGSDDEDDCRGAVLTVGAPTLSLRTLVESAPGSDTFIDADAGVGPAGASTSGTPVRYRFEVTNTGPFTLSNVEIIQPQLDDFCTLTTPFALVSGGLRTFNCTWPLGFGLGSTVINATARGTYQTVVAQASNDAEVIVTPRVARAASMTVDAVVYNVDTGDLRDDHAVAVGSQMAWVYTVTNTGDDPLTALDLTLADGYSIDPADCARTGFSGLDDPLPPGEQQVCTVSFSAIDGGESRTLSARAFSSAAAVVQGSDGTQYNAGTFGVEVELQVLDPSTSTWVNADSSDGLTPVFIVGSDANYRAVVTNSGVLPLDAVELTSPTGLSCGGTLPRMLSGDSETIECSLTTSVTGPLTHEVLAEHSSGASSTNEAIINVVEPLELRLLVRENLGGAFIEADDNDGLTGQYLPGETVEWRVVVTNNTPVEVTDVSLVAPFLASCESVITVPAMSSVTVDCTSNFASSIVGFVAAVREGFEEVSDIARVGGVVLSETVQIFYNIRLADGSWTSAEPGDIIPVFERNEDITWQVIVYNGTASTTFTNGLLHTGIPGCATEIIELVPGDEFVTTCTTRELTDLTRTATVVFPGNVIARNPASMTVTAAAPAATVLLEVIDPATGLYVDANNVTEWPRYVEGDTVTWRVTVVNTGNVEQTFDITDTTWNCGLSATSQFTIAIGETIQLECDTVAVDAEIRKVELTNLVIAPISDIAAINVSAARPEATVIVEVYDPETGTFVDANTDGPSVLTGSTVEWRVTVTNTGNQPLLLNIGDPTWTCDVGSGGVVSVAVGSSVASTCFEVINAATVREFAVSGSGITPASDSARVSTYLLGSIGQHVWIDLDGDDVFDSDEEGVGGLDITLLRGGIEVNEGRTPKSGEFKFASLRPGDYEVRFALPAGYMVTMSAARQTELQATVVNGVVTLRVTLLSGVESLDANLGMRQALSPPPPPDTTSPQPPSTTTNVVGDDVSPTGPLPTIPQEPAIGGGLLPATGNDARNVLVPAVALLLAGAWLVLIANRRRRPLG
jgi:LPXTG-motif cell wall-anchored protein